MSEHYPPDEFDRVPTSTGRRGAHRVRQSAVMALVPVVLVLLAVTGVAYGVSVLVGGDPPESAVTAVEGGTGDDTVGQDGTDPGADDGTADGAGDATGTGTPTEQPTVPSTPTPTGVVDRDAQVRVLNGTTTRGLAASGAEDLTDAGWEVSGTDNYRGATRPTTVFYAEPDLEATALAVAADLGGAEVELDPSVTESLMVVLGEDYATRAGTR